MSRVLKAIQNVWPTDRWNSSTIVLAVSGGPDSVALARAIHALIRQEKLSESTRLVIAHLNHRLRGVESDLDEAFVKELAGQMHIEAITRSLPEPNTQAGEAQWRKDRVAFLKQVAKDFQAKWIATGATADDSVETMVHHLLRGSGPAGLAGIRLERKLADGLTLVHPLIGVWKSELLEYLESISQAYRIDRSNLSSDFTRNRIRNECLPYLEKMIGSDQLKQRLFNTSELIRQEHEVIEQLANVWLESSAIRWGMDQIDADWKEISELPWPVLQCGLVGVWHRMGWPLQQIGFRHWDRVRAWVDAARVTNHPKRMQLPGPVELRISRRVVRIRSL